jgi:hypothetical protein
MIFLVLNLLAFFVHQILELCDLPYQRCLEKFSSRRKYRNQLRHTFRILLFKDFYHLLDFIFNPDCMTSVALLWTLLHKIRAKPLARSLQTQQNNAPAVPKTGSLIITGLFAENCCTL